MINFQIKGIEGLYDNEKQEITELLENSYEKLKRKLKKDFLFKIVVKVYSKDKENLKKRRKYSLQASISGETRNFEASSNDWILSKAVHGLIRKLEEEIEHVFHVSEQNKTV